MARSSGSNRGRLLLVMLIVSSLLLITLDLRGVSVINGARSAVGTALAPVQRVGNSVVTPFRNFFSDLFRLGTTRSTINKLKAENARLKTELLQQKNSAGQAKQLKESLKVFEQTTQKIVKLQRTLESIYENIGKHLSKFYEIKDINKQ